MAFTATGQLIVRSDGSDNNGGGFNPGNANMATDLAASLGTSSAPTVSSASYTFISRDIGHYLFVQAGTNWKKGWYLITAVDGGGVATLDATATNVTRWDGVASAIRPNTVDGIATVASPTSGTWSIDYSRGTGPAIAYTDMSASTTTFTSAANPVGKHIVGNYINITGGANYTLQRVEVVSTSGTTATVDKTLGASAGAGGTGNLGGAFATPGLAASIGVSGNDMFIKSGTYTLTSSSANVAGGKIDWTAFANNSISNLTVIEGFGTIPKDLGTTPVINAGAIGSSPTIIAMSTSDKYGIIRNIEVDCNNVASSTAFSTGNGSAHYCTARKFATAGFTINTISCILYRCKATQGAGTAAFNGSGTRIFCEAYANTCIGFFDSNAANINCIAYLNTGASTDGFQVAVSTAVPGSSVNCVSYGNGRDGFRNIAIGFYVNCIAESNVGVGFNATVQTSQARMFACGVFGNGTDVSANMLAVQLNVNYLAATSTFFVNAAAGNFALNMTLTGGALAKYAGAPGLYPAGTTTSYADIGAAQSRNVGGTASFAASFGALLFDED